MSSFFFRVSTSVGRDADGLAAGAGRSSLTFRNCGGLMVVIQYTIGFIRVVNSSGWSDVLIRTAFLKDSCLSSGRTSSTGEERPWLNAAQNSLYDLTQSTFLELHATAMLCLPSGECMCPDATSCTTLTSALYSSISEEDVLKRQLMVNVDISTKNAYCIEVVLRCLAANGDGLGLHEANDGGLLATVIAAGFKGELNRFQAGVTMEISRLDAWYSDADGSLELPATYILKGLCRRCCLPEIILRCMQVSVSLAESGDSPDHRNELIELVASSDSGMLHLFSQHQLQEFLLFERECSLYNMEFQEEEPMIDA